MLAWLESPNAFGARAIDGALKDAGVVRFEVEEVRAGNYASERQALDELRAAGFAEIEGQPGSLNQPWTVEDFIAFHTQAHDIEMMEAMSPQQKEAFLAALERRLRELPADAMVDRAAVVMLTARAS